MRRVVVLTVTNGDCGFDVMCLMSGAPRRVTTRSALRIEVGRFILKHAGNRAVVAALYGLAEIKVLWGLFELETAGAAIFAEDVGVVAVGDVNHAGGNVNHGDGVVSVRQ